MGSHQLVGKTLPFEEASRVPLLIRVPGQRNARTIARPVSQVDLMPTLLELLLGKQFRACDFSNLDGSSLAPLLLASSTEAGAGEEQQQQTERDVFMQWLFPRRTIIARVAWSPNSTDEPSTTAAASSLAGVLVYGKERKQSDARIWKLTCSARLSEFELYDLSNDPRETDNLALEPRLAAAGKVSSGENAHGEHVVNRKYVELLRLLCARIRSWQERVGDKCEIAEIS